MWQYKIKKLLAFSFLLIGTTVSINAYAQALSMAEAIELAFKQDLSVRQFQQKSEALKQQAIAADALPDPKLKLGFMNYPTDTFERTQEPMTQNVIGFQQMFPAGDTLEIKSKRVLAMSAAASADAENNQRKLVRDVRKAWLERFYWIKAKDIVKQNEVLFSELVNITSSQYAVGRHKQQDVIRAELELGMLQDRISKIETMNEISQSQLARLISDTHAQRVLASDLPVLPTVSTQGQWLKSHPLIKKESAQVVAGENNVSLAKQSYKPSWMLDLSYGQREGLNMDGSERADFLSAMLMFDLPLFTGNFQDKKVAASRLRLNSAQDAREDKKRVLKEMWAKSYTKWTKLSERSQQYHNNLIPKAKQNARASLFDYQNSGGSFNSLVRSQVMELETQLKAVRLDVDAKQAQAQLLYLAGEEH